MFQCPRVLESMAGCIKYLCSVPVIANQANVVNGTIHRLTESIKLQVINGSKQNGINKYNGSNVEYSDPQWLRHPVYK